MTSLRSKLAGTGEFILELRRLVEVWGRFRLELELLISNEKIHLFISAFSILKRSRIWVLSEVLKVN